MRDGRPEPTVVGPIEVADAAAMEGLAARLVQAGLRAGILYLEGELGTGKTTFARGLLTALGAPGPIRSPTFTLVESHCVDGGPALHVDLYRIADPEELDYIGLGESLDAASLCLVEWPDRGGSRLPAPGLTVRIRYHGHRREVWLVAHDAKIGRIIGTSRGSSFLR